VERDAATTDTSSMIPRSHGARAAWAVFLAILPIYLATMSRTIGFIDRGELAAVAWTFGIAHAPGYPTLMLLAGALTHLVPVRPLLTLNVLTAVMVAAGGAIMVLLLDRILAEACPTMPTRRRAAGAAAAALFASLTMTWWQQANGFEVYALHALFMPLVVWLALRWTEAAPDQVPRAGFAFGLVTGLSFTNHLTTGLLAPGLIAMAIVKLGWGRTFWRRIAGLTAPFALGLLPYAWLPIRSSMHPRFDWGDPETLRRFLHHVTASDYHGRLFSDPISVMQQLRYLVWRLPSDFAWVGLVVAGLGALWLARRSRGLLLMALLCLATGFAFAAGYRIPDIDAYLMTIVLGFAVCFVGGLAWCTERYGIRSAAVVAIALVALNGSIHWRDCDESGNHMSEAFVIDMLGPLPPNAVLISPAWDIGLSASCYFQEVEGFRRDVVVINPDLTRASWYLNELSWRAPGLVARSGDAFTRYRDTREAIERGAPYRGAQVESQRQEFLAALAAGAMRDRPVFTTTDLPAAPASWRRVPFHLAAWLRTDTSYVAEPAHRYAFRPWLGHFDAFSAKECWGYGVARLQRARYEDEHGRYAEGRAIAESVRGFDPHIRLEEVGPLPLGTDATVLAAAKFFRDFDQTQAVSNETQR
jgi:MFS family permease